MNVFRKYQGKNILRHILGKDYAMAVQIEGESLALELPDPLPVTAVIETNPLHTSENWRAALQADETTNDSDKTFTVPASTEWEVLSIWIELTTTATVGNRQLEIQLQDSEGDVIGAFQVGIVQPASQIYNYLIAIAMPDLATLYDTNYLITPLPAGTFLSAGEKVRIWDNNAVDAAADDMNVQMKIAYRTV
jgi:hypothetical protein